MSRQRVPEGPAPDPAVQKLRIRYTKRGRLRFTSSRDFQRALERALRRADVPMAFSAGFHPHPKISYANAAATGTASEAEYVEIQVTRRLDPEAVRLALDAALPDGIDIEQVIEPEPGALADLLEASRWRLEFENLEPAALHQAVEDLLGRPEAAVSRMTKSGLRTFDVRAAIAQAVVSSPDEAGPCAILHMVVRHTTPAVRPDDILTALRDLSGLQYSRSPLVTRLAQGPFDAVSVTVTDPLVTGLNVDGS